MANNNVPRPIIGRRDSSGNIQGLENLIFCESCGGHALQLREDVVQCADCGHVCATIEEG